MSGNLELLITAGMFFGTAVALTNTISFSIYNKRYFNTYRHCRSDGDYVQKIQDSYEATKKRFKKIQHITALPGITLAKYVNTRIMPE